MKRWLVSVRRGRVGDGGVDQYGEPIPGDVVWEDMAPALFSPDGGSDALAPGVASVRSEPSLYWKKAVPDLVPSDVVEVSGCRFEVVGELEKWPLGCVARLRRFAEGV